MNPTPFLLGETAQESNLFGFTELIRMIHENKRNVIIVKEGEIPKDSRKGRRIDIWWGQKGGNAGLILALAHLMGTSPLWRNTKIVLKTIVSSADDQTETEKGLRTFVEQGRLEVSVETVFPHDSGLFPTIEKSSADANFIFIGLWPPATEEPVEKYEEYLHGIFQNTKGIPSVAYVLASEDLDFKKIFLST